MEKLLSKIDFELREIARRETKSVLRERRYTGLSSFTFEEILSEMQSLCPTVLKVLSLMVQLDLNREKEYSPFSPHLWHSDVQEIPRVKPSSET